MKQNLTEVLHEKAPSELPKLVRLQLTKISQFSSLSQRLVLARMKESFSLRRLLLPDAAQSMAPEAWADARMNVASLLLDFVRTAPSLCSPCTW